MAEIKILWMYPSVLNLHGDRGNQMALERMAQQMGLPLSICRVEAPEDSFDLEGVQMICFNSGQVRDMPALVKALELRRKELNAFAEQGGYILATGSSGAILADETHRVDHSSFSGLFLLPMLCRERKTVYGDDIWFHTKDGIEIIGNQIQILDTELEQETAAFGDIVYGRGNWGGADEGCRRNNVIFTNTLGPMLVKNPRFTRSVMLDLAKMAGIEPADIPEEQDWDYEDRSAELIRTFIRKKMA